MRRATSDRAGCYRAGDFGASLATAADGFCPRIADQPGIGSDRRAIEVQPQLRARYVWQGPKGAARACLTILTGETCAVVQLVQLDRVNTHGIDHNAKKRPAQWRASRSRWVLGFLAVGVAVRLNADIHATPLDHNASVIGRLNSPPER